MVLPFQKHLFELTAVDSERKIQQIMSVTPPKNPCFIARNILIAVNHLYLSLCPLASLVAAYIGSATKNNKYAEIMAQKSSICG